MVAFSSVSVSPAPPASGTGGEGKIPVVPVEPAAGAEGAAAASASRGRPPRQGCLADLQDFFSHWFNMSLDELDTFRRVADCLDTDGDGDVDLKDLWNELAHMRGRLQGLVAGDLGSSYACAGAAAIAVRCGGPPGRGLAKFVGAAGYLMQRQTRLRMAAEPGPATEEKPMLTTVKGPMDYAADGGPGLPWWWAYFWRLPLARRGGPGEPLTLGDTAHVFRTNIEQIYGNCPSVDGLPIAEGDLGGLTDGTLFLGLWDYMQQWGDMYKMCIGPKSFIVISEPNAAKHVLRDSSVKYNKGVLSEILEDIMGKGLIPADPETWKVRRRAIVPAFHKNWLNAMVGMFGESSERLIRDLDAASSKREIRDMEERFGSLALDIIGRAVFNYDFDSVGKTSPVVQAAIDVLREAEHRSMTPAPYWKIPGAYSVVPRQVAFKKNMDLLNGELTTAIDGALKSRFEEDVEDLENRDYTKMDNPSILRFLVDMRDEDATTVQLRDDLITMLIAGHETTASALTWAIFELVQAPEVLAKVRKEIDEVIGDRKPVMEDMMKLELVRLCVAESLRMYPEPPLLIRRAIEEDEIPAKGSDFGRPVKLLRSSDIFISVYNLHRSPKYWDRPDAFDPERFLRPFHSGANPEWKGFRPELWKGQLYPNEVAADFAYLPFGGGPRKCVGDQFALLEATVALAMLLRRYDFSFAPDGPTPTADKVGINTGATIHTRNGLWMSVGRRSDL